MDWAKVERTLYEATVSLLQQFAREHAHERFYGFILDVNADYGEVLLCLNTEAALSEWAAKRYPEYSLTEVDEQIRWNAGDWRYQGFNTERPYDSEWERAWATLQDSIEDACLDDGEDRVAEEFLEAVCRVALRLEATSAFRVLNREPSFSVLVSDHDEDLEDSRERMAWIRSESAV